MAPCAHRCKLLICARQASAALQYFIGVYTTLTFFRIPETWKPNSKIGTKNKQAMVTALKYLNESDDVAAFEAMCAHEVVQQMRHDLRIPLRQVSPPSHSYFSAWASGQVESLDHSAAYDQVPKPHDQVSAVSGQVSAHASQVPAPPGQVSAASTSGASGQVCDPDQAKSPPHAISPVVDQTSLSSCQISSAYGPGEPRIEQRVAPGQVDPVPMEVGTPTTGSAQVPTTVQEEQETHR